MRMARVIQVLVLRVRVERECMHVDLNEVPALLVREHRAIFTELDVVVVGDVNVRFEHLQKGGRDLLQQSIWKLDVYQSALTHAIRLPTHIL